MTNTIVKKTRIIKKLTLVFRSDPGHAWLKVPRKVLEASGVAATISGYSYQRREHVYLEEDCDAPKLLDALQKAGVVVRIKEKSTDRQSKIRSYDCYINRVSYKACL